MESETSNASNTPMVFHRLLPAFVSALLISIGYVDPGKWAATVEGGAHFGFDLVLWVLLCNLAAILCQYLSARIGVVTGRDLAEICSEEYDKYLCLLLGIQTEFAVIAMDLTMVLGIAHGLNLLLGVDLFTCVFLTAIDAVFYPLLASFLENRGAKFHCSYMAGFILFAYVFGILISQPEVSISMGGMLTNLSGERTFALMSLLGASMLPQNFYLHSALVRNQGRPDVSKDALCHDHFFAIFCIFSCIYLASYMLMSSAANVFYNTGIVLLTFQDALTLVEQVFRIPAAPIFFLLVLLGSSQVTALSWTVGGEVILHEFFGLDIPSWLHRVTVRIIAIIPAIYCVWNTGAEGIYELLIFMQVMVALLLPSSVIPLFRVASSRALMGVHKMSQIVGILALVTLLVMGCLNVVFVVEMLFGISDWAGNLRWNFGGNSSAPYVFLVVTAVFSLSLTLWLLATPLKSASITQAWNWDFQMTLPETEKPDLVDARLYREENLQEHEPTIPTFFKSSDCYPVKPTPSPGLDSHDLVEHELERHLTTIEEDQSSINFPEELIPTAKPVPILAIKNEICDRPLVGAKALEPEAAEPVEKTEGIEGDLQIKKDDGDVYKWEPEESSKSAPLSNPHLSSEGPGSLRSLTGKIDDGGNGAGSLSRLAGLGRAARRQLAAILDEFWGQLYDFHGQTTPGARANKLDLLLGIDPKAATSTMRSDTSKVESPGYFSSMSSSLFDSSEQQSVPGSLESPYGVQRGTSSLWSNQVRLLDEYVQNSRSGDASERRYSSLRLPPSSEGWNNQPATVHGYQLASYLNRIQAERNTDRFSVQAEPPVQKSLTMGPPGYTDSRPYAGQKLLNGLRPLQTSSYQNVAPSANSLMQSERSYYETLSPGPHSVGHSVNTKKYHSLPDISGASVYQRALHGCDKNVQWDSHVSLGSSANRTAYEPSMLSNSAARVGAALAFDDLSPSGKYRNALSMQLTSSSSDTASLWSRQPFEQFGVADKTRPVSGVIGSRSGSLTKELTSSMDSEAMLLKSLRYCLLKLLKLEGSDWLFKQNDGADEELIDRVAAREKFIYEAEHREMNRLAGTIDEPQYFSSNERKLGASVRSDDCSGNLLVSSVPHCGDECIWMADLIVSFGVWCIHRILDLSLMESRPELWGKYTYVLNRLQGIIDPAFLKSRTPMSPCFCLQLPGENFQPFGGPVTSNGMLPPTSKPGRGKCTTAPMLLDIIKDVEIAISSRKGRTGTAAGDVAFPKGKENLASVLKRYKRRLSNRPAGATPETMGSRKIPTSAPYCS